MIARNPRRRATSQVAGATAWLGVLIIGSFSPADLRAQEPAMTGVLTIAEELLDAFNRHDPQGMASLVSADFELYYVDEAGVADLAVQGPDQLRDEMIAYFANRPHVQSMITGSIDGPVYVTFREQIIGGRSSIAVYEVRERLIRRVWYFPSEGAGAHDAE